jgi:hypothetical protein
LNDNDVSFTNVATYIGGFLAFAAMAAVGHLLAHWRARRTEAGQAR